METHMSHMRIDEDSGGEHARPPWHDGGSESASKLGALIKQADRACSAGDGRSLSAAVRQLLPMAPETLGIDLVAVVELAEHDLELASVRWRNLRSRLQ